MHHYGEDAVEAYVSANSFWIELRNHETGAIINITGPRTGIFQDRSRTIDQGEAHTLANEIAHLLRGIT